MPNPIDISAKLKGLIPYEKYNFVFNSVGANWPTVVSPVSGSFTASSTSGNVDATVYFCPSKNSCTNCIGLLPFQDCLCNIGDEYFSKIQMSFSLDSDPNTSFKSDTIKVTCNQCLPKTEIISVSGSTLKANHKVPIRYIFDNLRQHQTYTYEIQPIHSDWPFYLSSTSGYITSVGVKDVLEVFGVFCATTGECPNCEKGILPYVVSTGCESCSTNPWTVPQTSFRLLLRDPDCVTTIHYSNVVKLECSDCGNNYTSVSVEANDLRNCSN